jgi:hypothetical protein
MHYSGRDSVIPGQANFRRDFMGCSHLALSGVSFRRDACTARGRGHFADRVMKQFAIVPGPLVDLVHLFRAELRLGMKYGVPAWRHDTVPHYRPYLREHSALFAVLVYWPEGKVHVSPCHSDVALNQRGEREDPTVNRPFRICRMAVLTTSFHDRKNVRINVSAREHRGS